MKRNVHNIFFAIALSGVVSGCGEKAELKKEDAVIAEKPVASEVQMEKADEVQNEGLYDLKNSINSAIGDSIEEDIRDAVENQVEKNNKQ